MTAETIVLVNLSVPPLPRGRRRRLWLRLGEPCLLDGGRVLTVLRDGSGRVEDLRYRLRLRNGAVLIAQDHEQLRCHLADQLVRAIACDEHGTDRVLLEVGPWAAFPQYRAAEGEEALAC